MTLFKACIGAIIVFFMLLLNQKLGPEAAAIVSWFPVFTIIGFVLVRNNPGKAEFENIRDFIVGGIWSLLLLAVFSAAIYFLISFCSLWVTLFVSGCIWLVGACVFMRKRINND